MLSSGVDRILEQVVKPKIHTVFKPRIDQVVCDYLGIDREEREAQLLLRRELQGEVNRYTPVTTDTGDRLKAKLN